MSKKFNRRSFLKGLMSTGAMASMGGVSSLFPRIANAAEFGDYKALVVMMMHGGNDAHNMVIPIDAGTNRDHATYALSRGGLSVANTDLGLLSPPDIQNGYADGANRYATGTLTDSERYLKGVHAFGLLGNDRFGINGVMPELAQLMLEGNAAVVGNIGTLIEPMNKADWQARTKKVPPFLFSHNSQQRAMESGWANNASASGWAGRMADIWGVHQGGVNGSSPLGMGISYSGASHLCNGYYNSPLVLAQNRYDLLPGGGFNIDVYNQMNQSGFDDSPLTQVVKAAHQSTVSVDEMLELIDPDYFADAGLLDPYGNALFTNPTMEQIEMDRTTYGGAISGAKNAALMIKLGQELGLKRQVIFISMHGFDNHDQLAMRHPLLLRNMSLGVWSFQQAMQHLGLSDQATLLSVSDFGRTLGNNGDGVDHAWAGHNIVVGGAVNGGQLFGEIPDMRLGGDSDISSGVGAKGRMIPTTSVEQYLAAACDWFGVSEADMWNDQSGGLFPNLGNFRSDATIRSAYLQGLMA